jgi:hypothetical protein
LATAQQKGRPLPGRPLILYPVSAQALALTDRSSLIRSDTVMP